MKIILDKNSAEAVSDLAEIGIDDEAAARICAALGHPVRIRIIRQLMMEDACCCKDIVGKLDLAQSTVSQHLKVLVQAGLIDYRPERQSSRYSVNWQQMNAVRTHFASFKGACCG
ncbi:ArsR family transcriptional regulator [Ochrobactrum sp. 30A/1000/2015]|nr:metalloregulator ArsR/SmtB family transcription factor [Brucella intermedia]PJT24479.1 ArsR family transcriptional regulator [Ochrobactrum sp. 30A/1000/2015]PJT36845.1 ArsR family transcriptional regulator [Ochrobactrum sp. 27A/999/2015]PJT41854.1 ArsR family transcriptional regulator [Ochrobactrum sp. 23A/997/2015]NKB95096.1 helix-turn-helix transcriptional regulator [Brucella intermedia]OAE46680.1 transcriptional regulator [Brucella intermedia]